MTKSITDLAREAGLLDGTIPVPPTIERFAALHRAAIIEELTGEMPEPYATLHHDDGYFTTKKREHDLRYSGPLRTEVVTLDQCREYAAGLVAKAVAAERDRSK